MAMKQKATKVYVSRVVVRCNRVPLDMMRYDRCVPATEEDAHKLERVEGTGEAVDVTFVRFAMNPGPPTEARWPGFGGKVLSWEPVS